MFALDWAWLIPSIPAVSFFAILFFGKRLPRKGSEIGIAAVGVSLLLSIIAAVEWINRVNDAEGHSEGLRAFGKGILGAAEHGTAAVQPVVHEVHWWRNGGVH